MGSHRASSPSSPSAEGQGLFAPAPSALRGTVRVPGDKSVSHRAILLGALAAGRVVVDGFLRSADTMATVHAVRALGVTVEELVSTDERLVVHGVGWDGLREPEDVVDVANAGTLIRLLPGILASCPFLSILTGDASIRRRPMARVIEPLRLMGAHVSGRDGDRLPPMVIKGGRLRGIRYRMEVASAQVKSCIILAGLRADSHTFIEEPGPSRDHTETIVRFAGGKIEREGNSLGPGVIHVTPLTADLCFDSISIPGDISSAAFLLVAALLVPGSQLTVTGVGLNPTRTGLLDALRDMGADLAVRLDGRPSAEPIGSITATHGPLTAADITADRVPLLIDEIPVWALAAARAEGVSRLRGAAELRVKESDRLAATAQLLRTLGVRVVEHEDGLDIHGRPEPWEGGRVSSQGDHRLAMVGAVAGLASRSGVSIDDTACMAVSYPDFTATIEALLHGEKG